MSIMYFSAWLQHAIIKMHSKSNSGPIFAFSNNNNNKPSKSEPYASLPPLIPASGFV